MKPVIKISSKNCLLPTAYCLLLTGLLLLIISTGKTWGQSLRDTIRIPEVRISSGTLLYEAGFQQSSIDSTVMASSNSVSLANLLRFYTPVRIKTISRGHLSTASFRGTAPSHTQVLWNGIRINSPMLGQVDFSLIPGYFTDRVRLLHGSSSLKEGSGGLGGAILLSNETDWKGSNSTALNMETGSFKSFHLYGTSRYGNSRIRGGTRLFFNSSENNYPFYNTSDLPHAYDRLENAGYRMKGLMQELYLRTGNHGFLSVYIWAQDSHRNLPHIMSFQGNQEEAQKDAFLRSVAEWKIYRGNHQWLVRSGINSSRIAYKMHLGSLDYTSYDSKSREFSHYNRIAWAWQKQGHFRAGLAADINYHRVATVEEILDQGYRADRLEQSYTATIHYRMLQRFRGHFLLRQEIMDGKFIRPLPSMGLEMDLDRDRHVVLKANLAGNHHMPTLNDLYWIPGGNPELKPESGYSADIGIHWEQKYGRFSMQLENNLFWSDIKDWIAWTPTRFRFWEARNLKRVISKGLESCFKMEYQVSGHRLFFHANYVQTRASETGEADQAGTGEQLVYLPRHSYNLFFRWDRNRFFMFHNLRYTGMRYATPLAEEENFITHLEAFHIYDIQIGRSMEHKKYELSVSLALNNLFNKQYQILLQRPMPGRNYSLNVQFKF